MSHPRDSSILSGVASDNPDGRTLSAREVTVIAVAFELQRKLVLADLAFVCDWSSNDRALVDRLRNRHGWDDTVAPFYLDWLRGNNGGDAQ
jgi:hypothetical protein